MSGAGSWRTVVGISFIWAFILGVGILFTPESPRWSARHGRPEAAREAIAKVRALPADHPIVDMELEEILVSLEKEEGLDRSGLYEGEVKRTRGAQASGLRGWIECFKGYGVGSSRVGYRTILGMCLQSLQQLTGANYVSGHQIFMHSSTDSNLPYVSSSTTAQRSSNPSASPTRTSPRSSSER